MKCFSIGFSCFSFLFLLFSWAYIIENIFAIIPKCWNFNLHCVLDISSAAKWFFWMLNRLRTSKCWLFPQGEKGEYIYTKSLSLSLILFFCFFFKKIISLVSIAVCREPLKETLLFLPIWMFKYLLIEQIFLKCNCVPEYKGLY